MSDILQLNQHPLNLAAAQVLKNLNQAQDNAVMHLLTLASLNLESNLVKEEGSPADPEDERALCLANYSSSLPAQQVALNLLDQELDPEDVLQTNPAELADQVADILAPVRREEPVQLSKSA